MVDSFPGGAVETLARQQLKAYNAADLDAFVGCYHQDVQVFDGGALVARGREAFRERYRALFEGWSFGAEVIQRMHLDHHCIDYETWWRVDPESGVRSDGAILVHYEAVDGLIMKVEFLR